MKSPYLAGSELPRYLRKKIAANIEPTAFEQAIVRRVAEAIRFRREQFMRETGLVVTPETPLLPHELDALSGGKP